MECRFNEICLNKYSLQYGSKCDKESEFFCRAKRLINPSFYHVKEMMSGPLAEV